MQTETVHPSPEGLLRLRRFRVTDLSIVTRRLTRAGSCTHLVATTAEQQTQAGQMGVEVHLLQAEGRKSGPEPRQLPLSLSLPPTQAPLTPLAPLQPRRHAGAVTRGGRAGPARMHPADRLLGRYTASARHNR